MAQVLRAGLAKEAGAIRKSLCSKAIVTIAKPFN
jgi:hypothetical protein